MRAPRRRLQGIAPGCDDTAPGLDRQRLLPGLRLSGAVLVLATRPSPDDCPEPGAAPALCGRRAAASATSPPAVMTPRQVWTASGYLGLRLSVAVLVLAARPSPDDCPEPGAAPALCGRRAPPPRRRPASDEAERPRNMAAKYF